MLSWSQYAKLFQPQGSEWDPVQLRNLNVGTLSTQSYLCPPQGFFLKDIPS